MILSVIKPKGPTSFSVIYLVRKLTGIKTVGHAGTLDPLASGILVVAIGRESTVKIESLMLTQKEYEAEITLGQTSATDDSEGIKTQVSGFREISENEIQNTLQKFVGTIEQTPPLYSAIKVHGRPLYDYARSGKTVPIKSRLVAIDAIEFLSYSWPLLTIRVTCGKGVYIRSLARDIGAELKVGGFISKLNRTRVGTYTYENSYKMEDLEEILPLLIKKSQAV